MKGIGGNVTATLQISETETNAIGEQVRTWADLKTLTGWLDRRRQQVYRLQRQGAGQHTRLCGGLHQASGGACGGERPPCLPGEAL